MKSLLTVTLLVLIGVVVVPSVGFATPQCPNNATPEMLLNDPACWKSETVTVSGNHGGCWLDGGCADVAMGTVQRSGCYWETFTCNDGYTGIWCVNHPSGTGDMGKYSYTTTQNTCYHITSVTSWSACINGDQFATNVTWGSTSGTKNCTHVPTQRQCCDTPTSSMTVNGNPSASVSVVFTDTFNVDMVFSTSDVRNGYSCTFTPPAQSSFISQTATYINSVSWNRTGRITDIGPGPSPTPRTFRFECTHPSDGCENTLNTVNVLARPEDFTVNITTNPTSPVEVIDTVRWFATPSGGVPPYRNYSWSGSVSGSGTNSDSPIGNFIQMRYGVLGTQTAQVSVQDSWGQTATDEHTITIQDTRTPQ